MDKTNPYQTLGVSRTASQDEIKNAYRDLAKKFHPDLNPGNANAEKKFKEINAAYELIGTPEQKAKFDRGEVREEGPGEPGFNRGPFYYQTQREPGGRYSTSHSFSDEDLGGIFESIFGRQGGRQSRPREETYTLEVDLSDAVLGAEREFVLPEGTRLSVKIPQGVTTGTRLRFANVGGRDVYVVIQVRPSSVFQQKGDDLFLELPISLNEAILGGNVQVPTVGQPVVMKIPPGVNTGSKLRLSGQGAFNRKLGRRGDQIVSLKVVLPKTIDSELEKAIRDWSQRHPYNPREQRAA